MLRNKNLNEIKNATEIPLQETLMCNVEKQNLIGTLCVVFEKQRI